MEVELVVELWCLVSLQAGGKFAAGQIGRMTIETMVPSGQCNNKSNALRLQHIWLELFLGSSCQLARAVSMDNSYSNIHACLSW